MSNEKQETSAGIIAEMRQGTRLPGYWRSCDVNEILMYHADRLEAAMKRERLLSKSPENDNSGSAIYTGGSMVAMRSCLVNILVEMIDLGGMEVGRKAKFSPDAIANEIREALAVQTEEYGQGSDEWKDICAKCMDGDIEPKFCAYYGEPNGCNSPIYGEHPTTEKSSEVGNAAVLREALDDATKDLRNLVDEMRDDDCSASPSILRSGWANVLECICVAMEAALSAPPRNCDVGAANEQIQRHVKWCESRANVCWYPKADKCKACFAKWAQMPYEEGSAK